MITPWLQKYWEQSTQALAQGRLAHALLISGCAGLGKLDFAYQLAQRILCQGMSTEACGECPSCHWFRAQSHPDFRVITPEEDKKQIGVGQIRDLTAALTKTGYGRYQVVILHPAETMNRASANALLKTLEEPNGEVILLLVCDHPAALLPTIRSRCREMRVQQPPTDVALDWLTGQLATLKQRQAESSELLAAASPVQRPSLKKAVSAKSAAATPAQTELPSAAEFLALADGLPMRALRLASSGEWQQHNTICAEFIQVLRGQMTVLKAAEVWSKQPLNQVLTILSTLVQDMIRLMTGLSLSQIQHRQRASDLQELVQRCRLHQLWAFWANILSAKRRAMTSANPNVQLLLESVLISYFSDKVK
jgi:DNA polymerase-3 subunit delta'